MSTVKYHVSPTSGKPERCKADKEPCPLGGEHYSTAAEANIAIEKQAAAEAGHNEFGGADNIVDVSKYSDGKWETATVDDLNDKIDFDVPFVTNGQGEISGSNYSSGVYAPDYVYYDSESGEVVSDNQKWEPVKGYSLQGNDGLMHSSEYLGGGMAKDVLEEPGVYVTVAVDNDSIVNSSYDEDSEDFCDDEPAGWALMKYVGDE